MKKLLLIFGLLLTIVSFSQKEKVEAYVNLYKEIAIKEMQRSGVPAAITLAQGILESQFGESNLSIKSNNHFGIKCKLDWTGEKVYHDDDSNQECFRKYGSVEESYRDHSNFLKTREHYASLFQLDPTDFIGWAKGLKKAGYATEKDYPQNLIKLIDDYNLNQYSLIALNKTKKNIVDTFYTASVNKEELKTISNTKITTTIVDDEKDEVETNGAVTKTVTSTVPYSKGVFAINNSKVIYAEEGTSMLALAQQYNISLSKLLEFNDIDAMDILEKDQLIYLEKKQKKGINDFHIVVAGETLHHIAQKEGVRLDAIVEYNSTHKKLNPLVGEKIYLRSKAVVPPKMSLAGTSTNNKNPSTIN
jgi:LysM repeat protein